MRLRHIAVALVPLAFAACMSDTPTTVYPLVPIESTTFAPALNVNLATSTKTASGLYYRDITVGTGKTVTAGDTLNVKYVGQLADGSVFDSGTYRTIIPGNVIQGWNEGLIGVKIGGMRQLIIPPALGYGSSGSGPIPPNAVLVFSVQPI
jgi:FKBP-type peptidyl-prolyl cis-trans isomerase FkpA